MSQHPLILQFLNQYVKKPLEGTLIDVYVFAPCKEAYLAQYRAQLADEKRELQKDV